MSSKTLCHAIERDLTLLPCPEVAMHVMEVTGTPDCSAADLETIILRDPAMSAKLLKLANSAYCGVRERVPSVRRAIVLLGFRTTRNVALAVSLSAWFKRGRCVGGIQADDLWRHSLRVAVTAEVLARRECAGGNPEEAFLAGLLHDLGILAAFEVCPRELEQALELRASRGVSYIEAERLVLGVDHCRTTHRLLERWSLPEALREAASCHHAHEGASVGLSPMANTVTLAEALCAGQGVFSDSILLDESALCSLLQIEPEALPRLNEQIAARWDSAQAWAEEA